MTFMKLWADCMLFHLSQIVGDWWSTYGLQTPTLQHMAIRILNLTTSSSGCERNWSTFEMVTLKSFSHSQVSSINQLVKSEYSYFSLFFN